MKQIRTDGVFEVRSLEIITVDENGKKKEALRRVWMLTASVDCYRAAFKRANKWWVTDFDEELEIDVLRAGPLDTLKAAKIVLMMLGPTVWD